MDHIALPNSHGTHLHVPYLAQEIPELSYDYLGFGEFPQRKGFNFTTLQRNHGANNPVEHATIFQSWCFCGLIVEFFKAFGLALTIEDFLVCRKESAIYLSTQSLPSLSRDLEAMTYVLSIDERAKIYRIVKPLLVTMSHAARRLADDTASSTWQIVCLSILSVGEYLENMVKFFLQSSDPTPSPWFGRSTLALQLMNEAGWCPSLSAALLDQEVEQSSIYYLSRIQNHYNSKNHASCPANYCVLDKLDHKTYRTRHAEDCRGLRECSNILLDSPTWILLTDIVEAGQIPLLTVLVQDGNYEPKIKVTTSEESFSPSGLDSLQAKGPEKDGTPLPEIKPYVCISHVWSE